MSLIIDDHEYKAVLYKSNHGKQYAPMRYCIIDVTTGEIVDNAQGYGYTSAQKAYSGFSYRRTHQPSGKKNRSKEEETRCYSKMVRFS